MALRWPRILNRNRPQSWLDCFTSDPVRGRLSQHMIVPLGVKPNNYSLLHLSWFFSFQVNCICQSCHFVNLRRRDSGKETRSCVMQLIGSRDSTLHLEAGRFHRLESPERNLNKTSNRWGKLTFSYPGGDGNCNQVSELEQASLKVYGFCEPWRWNRCSMFDARWESKLSSLSESPVDRHETCC